MQYTKDEILQFVEEEDVRFIRLAFCDIYGKQKNISISPDELGRAFRYGIAIDGSAVDGFGVDVHSDLFLHPDASTIAVLPWRPEHGKVVRMFCTITYPDGSVFEGDTRSILIRAIQDARQMGVSFSFGSEMEFYLFRQDENGEPTQIPHDQAGYMDIAPEDKGENVRREICLTLSKMGIQPESSHHEEGPGQNEIDFRYSDPLTAADDAMTFRTIVATTASRNGLHADFSPKPLPDAPGNGMHINISAVSRHHRDVMPQVIAGILAYVPELTVFLNRTAGSYLRFGSNKAPRYISWSSQNRSQLVRIPAAWGEYVRAELRSPDPLCNPYLAFALMIWAGLAGIEENLPLPEPADLNLYHLEPDALSRFAQLPGSLAQAQETAKNGKLIAKYLPRMILEGYTS